MRCLNAGVLDIAARKGAETYMYRYTGFVGFGTGWKRVHEDRNEDTIGDNMVEGTVDTRSGKAYMPLGKS